MRYPKLRKWNIWYNKASLWYERGGVGWREVHFGIFYLNAFPPDGEELRKPYYSGFLIRLRYWLPFEFR